MRLYRGDVVLVPLGPEVVRGIIREIDGHRAMVQIGGDWTWVVAGELRWNGECLVKLPHTERGWRKLGKAMAGA